MSSTTGPGMPRVEPHPFLCPGLSDQACGPAHEGFRLTVAADMSCPHFGQASLPRWYAW